MSRATTTGLPVDTCIVGLGVTEQGVRLGIPPRELRRQALDAAIADAGLDRSAVDGYIGTSGELFDDIRHLGLAPRFSYSMQSGGATAIWSVLNAVGAIATGQATTVACVYGAAPTAVGPAAQGQRAAPTAVGPAAQGQRAAPTAVGPAAQEPGAAPTTRGADVRDAAAQEPSAAPTAPGQALRGGYGTFAYGYPRLYGMIGAAATHALHARRHFHRYGTTSRHLGAVAVQQRRYASVRPGTLGYGQPFTLEDHQASRMVVDPFRLLDCCRDTDGGVALLVTTADRARSLRSPGVAVLGLGTGHNIRNWWSGEVYDHHDDVAPAAATAFGQAGLSVRDVDVAAFYDPFTISVIMQLEAYGFCPVGEGGPFVESGAIAPGGAIPTNTGGGQLSGFYATGFTAVVEGLRQLRGEGGATQVPGAEVALVSGHGGNGGVQGTWAHATMLLGAVR